MKAGFIGLGHMGLPMALNLMHKGYEVTGFDRAPGALDAFQQAGGIAAGSVQELAKSSTCVITMLQTGLQVKEVCLGSQGIYAVMAEDALHIDCSTIDVKTCRELHQAASGCGLLMLDAPVSGGVRGAMAGTLTFMTGGEDTAFEKAQPVLAAMGKNLYHAGSAGSGQAAKICNNMILGVSMIAVSEAFKLAEKLGLGSDKLFEIVNNSSGQCWTVSHYVPVPGLLPDVPANRAYQPGFTAAMMLKDLRLSQLAADEVSLETAIGRKAMEIYQQFAESGRGELDFSAIIQNVGNP